MGLVPSPQCKGEDQLCWTSCYSWFRDDYLRAYTPIIASVICMGKVGGGGLIGHLSFRLVVYKRR